jgi:hypothetical protein
MQFTEVNLYFSHVIHNKKLQSEPSNMYMLVATPKYYFTPISTSGKALRRNEVVGSQLFICVDEQLILSY